MGLPKDADYSKESGLSKKKTFGSIPWVIVTLMQPRQPKIWVAQVFLQGCLSGLVYVGYSKQVYLKLDGMWGSLWMI